MMFDNFFKKLSMRAKFRIIVFFILLLGITSLIGNFITNRINIQKTKSDKQLITIEKLVELERNHIVRIMGLEPRALEFKENKMNLELLYMAGYGQQDQKGSQSMGLQPTAEQTKKLNLKILEVLKKLKIEQATFSLMPALNFHIIKEKENIIKLIQEENKQIEEYITLIDKVAEESISHKLFFKETELFIQKSRENSYNIKNDIYSIKKKLVKRVEELDHLGHDISSIMMISIIIIAIITISIILMLLQYIRNNIFSFTETLNDYSKGTGDLTVEMPADSSDTLGILGQAFNLFLGKIRVLVTELKDSVAHVKESSTSILDFAQQGHKDISSIMNKVHDIKTNSSKQSQNVLKTIDDIEDMVLILDEIAQKQQSQTDKIQNTTIDIQSMVNQFKGITDQSQQVDQSAHELLKIATTGVEMVNNNLASIREIQEDSSRVGDIVTVIGSIAEQTNLLAMNASIEAAHAGEFGKGFAVVADEVRKLAENSSQASKEISDLIKNMIGKIEISAQLSNQSSTALETILRDIEITTSFIKQTNQEMSHLTNNANNIINSIDDVVEASKDAINVTEAGKGIGQVVLKAINTVKDFTQNINIALQEQIESTESIAANVESLTDYSQINDKIVTRLKELSDQFKTDKSDDSIKPL